MTYEQVAPLLMMSVVVIGALAAAPFGTGSRPSDQAASRLRRSGFDPSRKEAE